MAAIGKLVDILHMFRFYTNFEKTYYYFVTFCNGKKSSNYEAFMEEIIIIIETTD